MKPSEVRQHVLRDHEMLRALLEALEQVARRVDEGSEEFADDLRAQGSAFLDTLQRHMAWEDRFLEPALREADAWGEERADQLSRDHREQREILGRALDGIRDGGRPPRLHAQSLLDLVDLLRSDMQEEEETLLDERVLRDDTVGIDTEAG